ncbi:MAG: hypothetical protein ABI574_19805, partial [Burkholderiales bacterium]
RALIISDPLSAARGELTDKGTVNQRLTLVTRQDDMARLFAPPGDGDRLEWPDLPTAGARA